MATGLRGGATALAAMFTHMLKLEKLRLDKGQSSRFEDGSVAFLKRLKASWQDYRYEFDVRASYSRGYRGRRPASIDEGRHRSAGSPGSSAPGIGSA